MTYPSRPPGITALCCFFLFGAVVSGLAAVMLLFSGSVLEPLWRLNPSAREGFAAMGLWAVLLMAVVCVACGAAALGLRRCKRWGYWTALGILTVNLVGDTTNAVITHDWRTLIGLPIGGAMIMYLLTKRSVFAAQDRTHVGPRLSAGLSYVILLGGMFTIAVAVYTILVSYSSLPWRDTWKYIATIAKGESPLSPSWLWRQHYEHRLVIQKLFFVVDLEMFHARQVFLFASIVVIQLLHLGLWGWSMRGLGRWRGALWRSGVGLAAFCIFCPSPWLNYTMGFQVCYVLSPLFATLSFVGLLLYWTDSQRPGKPPSSRFLWLSIFAALGGTYSLANGNLLWPLLVAAALFLRLRASAVLSFAITGAVSTSLYFYRYVRPSYHADPIASLGTPLRLLEYVALYIGSSWVNGAIVTAGVIGIIGLAIALVVLLRTPYYVRTSRAFALQLVLTGAFCVGTAVITAAGRLNFGVTEALQNRYQTFALLFWCSLGLMLLEYAFSLRAKQYRFLMAQICLLVVLVRGAILADHPIQEAQAHGFGDRKSVV